MIAGKILLVEDLPDVRITLSGLISDEGYEVRSASNKFDALKLLEAERFHVAVLDVRLDATDQDNKDGLLLMHEIKEKSPNTAIIILTGYADINMVREALQPDREGVTPAFGFLEKTEIEKLPEYIDRAFEYIDTSVRGLIAQGEQEDVEFKSSIRWDYKNSCANKRLQKNILKAIVGMMNNKGGVLLIGVSDDGSVLGIEKDLQTLSKPNRDKAELLLTNIIQSSLGLECIKYLDIHFETIDQKTICAIHIQPSPSPVFLETGGKPEFFVRVRNSTRKLDIKTATEYIRSHWEN
jgi:predicted HTH transcriptional regulator